MSLALDELKSRLLDLNALTSAVAMMDWDQQTYMPKGGARARAEHLGRLAKMAHETLTSDETRQLVEDSKLGAEGDDLDLLRVVTRDLDLATKVPTGLVAERSRLAAIGHDEWVRARANNDFAGFAPTLERMFEIAREIAECLGYKDHVYDALFDQYEEGSTAAEARAMFEAINKPQVELVKEISSLPPVDDSILYGEWPEPKQRALTELLVKSIGFDMDRGRQDTAAHPFCTGWSMGDIRLTTRFKNYVGSAIFGSLHEAGHGMYEQGTPLKWDLTPLAGGASLGIHESQSRTWENIVGRSLPFWQRFLGPLQEQFPVLGGIEPKHFYKIINKVQPSLIRVEADELTYNLHVQVRFEIECDVLSGNLPVKGIPEAWNEKYRQYLGIVPSTDTEGCLQDVHWSGGSIGYFPTYSMGNVLSYQIWNALQRDIPNTDDLIREGNFQPILQWLIEKIYSRARQLKPKELVKEVTGKALDPADYIQGLSKKYREIYGLG